MLVRTALLGYLVATFCLVSLCVQTATAAPKPLTELNLTGKLITVKSPGGSRSITGTLPAGCTDNSEWNSEISVGYRLLDDKGARFLRMTKGSDSGRAQLSFSLPKETTGGYYRLELRVRTTTDASPSIGVRQAGPPYTFLWSVLPTVSGDWKDYSYDFTLETADQPLVLLVNQEAKGSLDMARVKLVKMTEEELIADLRTRYANYPGGNLVRNSRFPLGMPAGWAIGRDISDGDDLRISVDRKVWGPSTFPAMRVWGDKIDLATAPVFTPWVSERHTASIFIRGKGSGDIKVMAGPVEYGSSSYWATSQWQRVEVPFWPSLNERCYYVKIVGTGDIYIDGLQIEKAEIATDYKARLPMEVAVGFPPSDASPARVQFGDEKAEVTYAVTGRSVSGSASGLVLRAKVFDIYGDSQLLPAVNLSSAPLQEGRIGYDLFPNRPYGQFRVEAWVEDRQGKPMSSIGEALITRVRRPKYWGQDAPDSPFGIHTLSTTRHVEMAKAMGINWARLHDAGTEYVGWAYLEPEKGQWAFRDKDIKRYRQYGMKLLGLLSTAPGWATNLGRPVEGYYDKYLRPLRLADFADYVTKVTQRYVGVIDSWEIWNEPWCGQFFTERWDEVKQEFVRSDKAPQLYAELQQTAFKAAKAVQPSLRIVGISSTGNEDSVGKTWTAEVTKAGGLASCDAVSYHHYASDYMGRPDDESLKAWTQAIGPIQPQGGPAPKPVWMSEGTAVAGMSEKGMYNYTVPFEADEDLTDISNRLCRYVLETRARGAEKVFLYSMHSQDGHIVAGHNDWRTFVSDDGYLHASAAAFSAMAWLTEDTRPISGAVLAKGVNALFFEAKDGSRSVAVLLPERVHGSYSVPGIPGTSVWDLYGNPGRVGEPLAASLVYLERAGRASELEALLRAE